jgi:hypothetical protein
MTIELVVTRPPFSEEPGLNWVAYPESLTIQEAADAGLLFGPFENELEAEETAAEIEIYARPASGS